MKRFLTVPFVLECVMYPDGENLSYVIVRDPDNRVSSVDTNLYDAIEKIYDVLDELVFTKNNDINKDEN